ncbi:MAG: hypothetical protein AB1353_08285 [Aquificota bacterium]|jgi:hypothetical protein|nr:hypothetical protein [Aquificaceae bacterium]MDM7266817.1 hypothetical protein [Aquificaceae bacterium]HAV40609.1 hypothetical protein [Aquificaceae bacterium]HCO39810.1 hypothetical protein [Aquificaceae bacterium]
MRPEVLLSLYVGLLFSIVFIVAPSLLRVEENKNLAGRFYGTILWRFYKVAFLLLMFYLILGDERIYTLLLMLGLGLNVGVSYWLKKYKKELGNIDLIDYRDPKRVVFRRVSMLSTLLLFINFLFSFYLLFKKLKGGAFAGV